MRYIEAELLAIARFWQNWRLNLVLTLTVAAGTAFSVLFATADYAAVGVQSTMPRLLSVTGFSVGTALLAALNIWHIGHKLSHTA